MLTDDQSAKLMLLAERVRSKTLTQLTIAQNTGVHQSQVSRVLAGQLRRASPNVLKLCEYAKTLGKVGDVATVSDDDAIEVIKSLMGRSAKEDRRLYAVVSSLKAWREGWGEKA
jgi:transcriptional regulator with XRE-family HTH domain